MNTQEIGRLCESYVCDQLQKHGFSVLARNFRVGKGTEIDIVAQKDDTIHFIEVKARSQTVYGLPREAVTPAKMQRIIKASELFTAQYGSYDYKRAYDVAEVYFSQAGDAQLKIIKLELLYHVFGG